MAENYWDKLMQDDEHAACYMETYGEGPGFELRHKIGSLLKEDERVLDVGCGPGWNLDHFCEYGPALKTYSGVDYSERFVRVANHRLGRDWSVFNHVPQMFGFEVGDCRKLRWPDQHYDVVILQDCLEHTNGFETPVREALRVARRLVIITFWHLEDSDSPHINDDGDDGWGAWYDKREWEKYLDTLDKVWVHERLVIGERHRDIYEVHV